MHTKPAMRLVQDITVVLCACGPILFIAAWMCLPDTLGESIARAMTPPHYPGMRLLDTRRNELVGAAQETRLYLSDDNVLAVSSWLNKRMPGFDLCSSNSQASCWQNEVCDRSMPAELMLRTLYFTADASRRPCVRVMLRSDAYGSSRTLVEVKMVWPKSS